MDDVYGDSGGGKTPSGGSGGKGGGPLGWIKKKLGSLKEANPALFSFVTGCAAGAVILVGTTLAKNNNLLPSSGCKKGKKKPSGPKIKITVKEDQTLGDILVKYVGDYTDANVKQLAKENKLSNVDLILPGQVLVVTDNRQIDVKPVAPVPTVSVAKQQPTQAKPAAPKKAKKKDPSPKKAKDTKTKAKAKAKTKVAELKKPAMEIKKEAKKAASEPKKAPAAKKKGAKNAKASGEGGATSDKKEKKSKGFLFFGKK